MSLINKIALYFLSNKENVYFTKQFFSWNQLSTILIICYEEQVSEIIDFIDICKVNSISVHVAIILNNKKDYTPKFKFNHTAIDKKQFSLLKIPNQNTIQQLKNKNSDLLINLGNSKQIRSYILSKLTKSRCKLSYFQDSVYDIVISKDTSTSVSEYLKQVIIYLKMIKTT